MRGLCRSTYIKPVLTSSEYNVFADICFFGIYLCLSGDFVNQHAFCSSIYIETALNSREECIEFADLLFWRLSLCLSRDSLSRDIGSLGLCILFKFIRFLYLWYIPLHSCAFDTFYFTPIFSYVYYRAKYFSYPWWHCCSKFNYYFFKFSSQRPRLNYIFLSNVYSFDTMEFSMK